MKKIFTHLPQMQKKRAGILWKIKNIILPPLFWLLAHIHSTPGLYLHWYVFITWLRLKHQGRQRREVSSYLRFPMDSVRYFEFNFIWKTINRKPIGRYFDLSSPRLLLALLLERFPETTAIFVNPDEKDLKATKKLMRELEFTSRCTFVRALVDDVDYVRATFDTITSISVIEHIPGDGDTLAIRKLWSLLKPGGRLFISVPCASVAIEEFIDFNEYGILKSDANNFVFGQRFYDKKLLQEKIFDIIGNPINSEIYGEKKNGTFFKNRENKISNPLYEYWREPYMMGKDYRFFDSVDELPGLGVIAMEFQKA